MLSITKKILGKIISLVLVASLVAVVSLCYLAEPAYADVGTFYAHSEASDYSADTNKMDQAPPEPNADETSVNAGKTGEKRLKTSLSDTNTFYTAGWPSADTISAGTWTFHTWTYTTGSSVEAYVRVKVYKNQDATPLLTVTSASQIPTSYTEIDATGSFPATSMAAGDRLRFEYYANIVVKQGGKKIYWKIDHDSSAGTRVDTTVSQIVPTLGWTLFFIFTAMIIAVLVRRKVLTLRRKPASSLKD